MSGMARMASLVARPPFALALAAGLPVFLPARRPWRTGGTRQEPEVSPQQVLRLLGLLSLLLAMAGTFAGVIALD